MFLRLILCKTRITHTGDLIQWATKTVAAAKAVAGNGNNPSAFIAKNRGTIESSLTIQLNPAALTGQQ